MGDVIVIVFICITILYPENTVLCDMFAEILCIMQIVRNGSTRESLFSELLGHVTKKNPLLGRIRWDIAPPKAGLSSFSNPVQNWDSVKSL